MAKSKQLVQNKERDQRSGSPSIPVPVHNTRSKGKTLANAAATSADVTSLKGAAPSFEEARSLLTASDLIPSDVSLDAQLLAKALSTLASNPSLKLPASAQKIILSLSVVASKIVTHCDGCTRAQGIPKLLTDCQLTLQLEMAEVNDKVEELDKKISAKFLEYENFSEAADKIKETVTRLDKVTSKIDGIDANFFKSLSLPTQRSNEAAPYRDALLNNATPGPYGTPGRELGNEISLATDRKERQVLIDCDEDQILANSYEVLLEKATHAIDQITSPTPPPDLKITHITKTSKNGLLINFSTKEAACWLRSTEAATTFSTHFIPGSSVKMRQYSLIVPRIPLTFNPDNPEHLREVEEGNGLVRDVVAKARWIKPAYRRKPEQRVAHATMLLNDVNQANKCIKEGMYICGTRVFPSRLKQEPTQCMKCRKWGHYAHECRETRNTCGTCGGEHRTSDCNEEGKKYCVSCKNNSHASWDRKCPEFAKRCNWYDANHPDNTLKFFPTDDAWTQEYRAPKLPFTERFPSQFAVQSLPPSNSKGRELPTREIRKQQTKTHKRKGKVLPGQSTLDGFGYTVRSQSRVDDERSEGEVESVISSSSRRTPSEAFISFDSSLC